MRYLSLFVGAVTPILASYAERRARTTTRTRTRARVRATARVRPYAPPLPVTEAPPAYEVEAQAALVRPYVLDAAHCARRRAAQRATAPARVSRPRRGMVVRLDRDATGHAGAETPPAPPAPPAARATSGTLPPAGLALTGVNK
ncbi:hypothetical protein [Halostreptopolyspora alba]|uniref:hypothetical protein n=1 Tax=Halostreptopolyspora alba TaxID=2487137 RepID=UPI002688731C